MKETSMGSKLQFFQGSFSNRNDLCNRISFRSKAHDFPKAYSKSKGVHAVFRKKGQKMFKKCKKGQNI